jgi:preprotein translocase subunit SecB
MTTKKARAAERHVSYTTFLGSLDIVSISLADSTFHGDRDRYFDDPKRELDVDWKTEVGDQWETSFDVRASVTIRVSGPKSKESSFLLAATYVVHVHAAAPMDPHNVKRFASSEVRLIVWPYVREYATSIFGRMHVPPTILPVIGSKGA